MEHGDAVSIAELLEERRFLLEFARWMPGGPAAAEGVVDETYRRWYALSDAARRRIAVPRWWLTRTAAGICLGMTPAPVADPVARTEPETAELSERAGQWLRSQRSRPTTRQQHDAVAQAVGRACRTEDGDLLTSLLCPDVIAFFDGGGKVRTLTCPVHGSRQVADTLLTLLAHRPRTTLTTHSVNGRTGLVVRYDDQVAAVIVLHVADDRAALVWVTLNPDKLRSWNQRRRGRTSSA
ncbi:RNA polymerase subunit sigma [Streptomyces sp. CA-249302]|uniref:RNA polymerase subunit sigma n=1 Tax=Streptomyces sp. CA-249302 TaxID=3240058 RepID=UPI003D8B8F45